MNADGYLDQSLDSYGPGQGAPGQVHLLYRDWGTRTIVILIANQLADQ